MNTRVSQFRNHSVIYRQMVSLMFILCLFSFTKNVFAEQVAKKSTVKAEIQTIVNSAISTYNLPSLVVSYKLPGNSVTTIYSGYSNLKPLKKLNKNYLFEVGSVTKSLNTAKPPAQPV